MARRRCATWITKLVKTARFHGLLQNRSISVLKTDWFSVKTEPIYCSKWFSVGFTSLPGGFCRF
jgi:hypothetical protein